MNSNLIIDGGNLLYKTYYISKNKPIFADNGLNIGHILYFLNSLKSYVENFHPKNKYICWDIRDNTFVNYRKTIYKEYKSQRSKDESDMVHQFDNILWKLSELLGFRCLRADKLEADDIISWLSTQYHKGNENIIVSNDKDFYQLIKYNNITIYEPNNKKSINYSNFRMCVEDIKPESYILYKSIIGDPSDNIRGLYRYGAKKATKLIKEFDNIKGVLLSLDKDKQKTVLNNMQVINLEYGLKLYPSECLFYEKQLESKSNINLDKFFEICEKIKLYSIIKYKSHWIELFSGKNQFAGLMEVYS